MARQVKSNHQSEVMAWTLRRGAGAVRTGLEDNIRIGKDRLVGSNAELVRVAVDLVKTLAARPRNRPKLVRRFGCGQCRLNPSVANVASEPVEPPAAHRQLLARS